MNPEKVSEVGLWGNLSCYHVKVMVPPLAPGESLLKDLKPESNMA